MLNVKKLEALLSSRKPVHVEFDNHVVEVNGVMKENSAVVYGEICPGMRGRVISVLQKEEDLFEFFLNLEEFYDYNYQIDPGDYIVQGDGKKDLKKWQDTIYYPKDHSVTVYTGFEIFEFKLLDESTNSLIEKFVNSKSPLTYVQWLEEMVKDLMFLNQTSL